MPPDTSGKPRNGDISNFDTLPDGAYVNSKQVRALYGNVSEQALHMWVKRGKIPPPEHPTGTQTKFWQVGRLRSHNRQMARGFK